MDERKSGFALTGHDVGATSIMTRVTITDNIVTGIDVGPNFNGDGRGFLINNDPIDMVIAHNIRGNLLTLSAANAIGYPTGQLGDCRRGHSVSRVNLSRIASPRVKTPRAESLLRAAEKIKNCSLP